MGFFKKHSCLVCGEEVGKISQRKIEDGIICADCNKKLSPHFHDRKRWSLERIVKQLEAREANKTRISQFVVTQDIQAAVEHVWIDATHHWFCVGSSLTVEDNPDVLDTTSISSIQIIPQEYHVDNTTKYDYKLHIYTTVEYVPEIIVSLNFLHVEYNKRHRIAEIENLGMQITMALNSDKAMASAFMAASAANQGNPQVQNDPAIQMNQGGMSSQLTHGNPFS